MNTNRKRHGPKLKAEVATEALKGLKTINEIASQYQVHPALVSQWKKQLQDGLSGVFDRKKSNAESSSEALASHLYEEIGRLKFELDWVKKKSSKFH
jgi:transposase-like protein